MSFFPNLVGAGLDTAMANKFGGLNTQNVKDGVRRMMDATGDAIAKTASFFTLLPREDRAYGFLCEQAEKFGLSEKCDLLFQDPAHFATAWAKINSCTVEEFCVRSNPLLITAPYQDVITVATNNKAFGRAIQAMAEARFPMLYLFRCIALGITATDENIGDRLKMNTFRTFFLRLALPGKEYDKFINYYVILTGMKDTWDELSYGQNGKLAFLLENVTNMASVQVTGYFEEKFEAILSQKFNELLGSLKTAS